MSVKQDETEKEVRGIGGLLINSGSNLKNALANSINQFSNISNWNIFTEVADREEARRISINLTIADYFELDDIRSMEEGTLILMKNRGRKMEDAFVRIHKGIGNAMEEDVDKNLGVKDQLKDFMNMKRVE